MSSSSGIMAPVPAPERMLQVSTVRKVLDADGSPYSVP